MNKTFVVMGTYNRAHLLKRSLKAYTKDVTLIIFDDGSTDETYEICHNVDLDILYTYLGDHKEWRDSACYLNSGIRFALQCSADYVFVTHPEIIVGKTSIQSAIELATDKESWINCKGYYLTPYQQIVIDQFNDVRLIPDFYGLGKSAEFTGNLEYLPESIEAARVWHSWIFGGGSKEMWQYFGGLTEFTNWGSVDVDLNDRRRIAGMKTLTPLKQSDFVIHQNHDNLGTPRDMKKCMDELFKYETKEQCLKPGLLL